MPRLVHVLALAASLAGPVYAQDLSPVHVSRSPGATTLAAVPAPDLSIRDAGQVEGAAAAPAAPREQGGFFSTLFSPIGGDFKNLATRDTALILAAGGAAALAAHPSDRHVTLSFVNNEPVEEALDAGSPIGGGYVQVGAAFGAYVVGRLWDKPQLAHVGGDLVRAQLIDTVMVQGLKFAAGRTRPDGSRYSFPSGHTASAFTTASVLQRHFGWKVGLPAYAMAAYVGGSRMAENRHYLSDVLFGAALGIVAGRAVTVGHGTRQFALTPIAVPGGAGIGLVHIGGN